MGEALLVRKGGGGVKVTVDGVEVKENVDLDSFLFESDCANTIYSVSFPAAVVYENELHLMIYSSYMYHHKYNAKANTWTAVGTLPIKANAANAVVYNNEIHFLGGSYHYKYNAETNTWTSVSTLPYSLVGGAAVVYNNEIHILGGNGNATSHYKFNGSSWVSVSTLPFEFYFGAFVVLNDAIHILGGEGNDELHYKFNGSSWVQCANVPYDYFYDSSGTVFENEIHILGGGSTKSDSKCYKYNVETNTWTSVSISNHTHINLRSWGGIITYNESIHAVGTSTAQSQHYKITKTYQRNFFN